MSVENSTRPKPNLGFVSLVEGKEGTTVLPQIQDEASIAGADCCTDTQCDTCVRCYDGCAYSPPSVEEGAGEAEEVIWQKSLSQKDS
jgi:hypothetical protein